MIFLEESQTFDLIMVIQNARIKQVIYLKRYKTKLYVPMISIIQKYLSNIGIKIDG
jgi:hypothetical protein